MEIQGPGGISGPNRIDVHRIPVERTAEIGSREPVRDRVEISEEARLLNKLAEAPDIRADRVEALRELIASGKFETPERISGAVEKILEEL
ncbi:MAG TPA: flagellar biosynthesis anti-sigma factor FlgM [Planctomycetota bacterium]|nr:flagellar biosynthesis anti-sigma factor FlgM [Planctomycetota bacterium]